MSYEYGGGAIGALVSLIVLFLLSRRLSVEAFGLYQLMVNLMVYGVIMLNFGLYSSLGRYLPEYAAMGRVDAIRALLRNGTLLIIAGGVCVGILSVIFRVQVAAGFQQERLAAFLGIVWLWTTARTISQLLEAALDALRGQVIKNRVSVAISLGQLAIFVGVLQLSNVLPWLIGAFIVIDLASVVSYALILRRHLAWLPMAQGVAPEVPAVRRVLQFGVKEYASVLLSSLWDIRVDLFLVSALLGPTAAGIFAFAIAGMNNLWAWSPGTLLRSISRPLFVEAHLNGENGVSRLFQWYLIVSLLLMTPLFLSAIVLYLPLVALFFKPEYRDGALIVGMLGIGMLGKAWLDPLRNVLVATERVGQLTVLNLFACTKLAVSYALIRQWGIIGAAIAFMGYILSMTVYLSWWARRRIGLGFPWQDLARIGVNGMGMVAVMFAGRPLISSLGSFVAVGGAGLAIYVGLTVMNPPFRVQSSSWRQRGREILHAIREVGTTHEPVVC